MEEFTYEGMPMSACSVDDLKVVASGRIEVKSDSDVMSVAELLDVAQRYARMLLNERGL